MAISIAISRGDVAATAVNGTAKGSCVAGGFQSSSPHFWRERLWPSYFASTNNDRRWIMPFLIPVLVGIPVLFGGGYVIYHLVH